MEIKIDILRPFFTSPNKGYTIRELSKEIGVNHTTVRQSLLYYSKEGIILKRKTAPYPTFIANTGSKKYLNLKLYHNLEVIRESGLIENLEHTYNYPPIVLFGSFSKAMDDKQSDVDICIITDVKKEVDLQPFEKVIGRKVSIHQFTKKSWEVAKAKNSELVNSIANGITLSGQLEIL